MKINIYIVLILICSYSFGQAQNDTKRIETEKVQDFSVVDRTITAMDHLLDAKLFDLKTDETTTKETLDATTVARNISDIRIYLNRIRKVHNLQLLFPKMDKAQVA